MIETETCDYCETIVPADTLTYTRLKFWACPDCLEDEGPDYTDREWRSHYYN